MTGAVVVLLLVLTSRSGVIAVAITVYVPGSAGAVRFAAIVPEAPAVNVPTLTFAACDVVLPVAKEMVTATEFAVALPTLLTVSWSDVVRPVVRGAVPSLSVLATRSALGA